MPDQGSIFKDDTGGTTPENNGVQNQNPLEDLLKEIKNERGEQKYRSIDEALKGLKNAQDFIPTLQSEKKKMEDELNALRAENEKLKTVEQTLERIASKEVPPRPDATSLNEESVARLVEQTLSHREKEKIRQSNTQSVVNTLMEKFGGEAEKEYIKKANDLGLTVDEFNQLAATSPKAVLQFFNVSVKTEKVIPAPGGAINTTDFHPPQDSKVKRNPKSIMIGASSEDKLREAEEAKAMLDELDKNGMSVRDLSNPKVYFKVMGKK